MHHQLSRQDACRRGGHQYKDGLEYSVWHAKGSFICFIVFGALAFEVRRPSFVVLAPAWFRTFWCLWLGWMVDSTCSVASGSPSSGYPYGKVGEGLNGDFLIWAARFLGEVFGLWTAGDLKEINKKVCCLIPSLRELRQDSSESEPGTSWRCTPPATDSGDKWGYSKIRWINLWGNIFS